MVCSPVVERRQPSGLVTVHLSMNPEPWKTGKPGVGGQISPLAIIMVDNTPAQAKRIYGIFGNSCLLETLWWQKNDAVFRRKSLLAPANQLP
jgi:hypothetical protein